MPQRYASTLFSYARLLSAGSGLTGSGLKRRAVRLAAFCAMVLSTIALLVALGGIGSAQAQTVYHVTETGDASNSGASFAGGDALSLQGALSAAGGSDVIVIATGRYRPTSNVSDRDARFEITGAQDGLTIYGGWDGTESFTDIGDVENQLASRDLAANPTVLSGDIDGNDTTNADEITKDAADISGANSYTVLSLDGRTNGTITTDTVLDGLTITGGQANDSRFPNNSGGGLYCDGIGSGNACSPTLTGLTFTGNFADYRGGALYNDGSSSTSNPQITNATFTGNSANFGGAVFNDGGNGTSSPVITNATFTGNSANYGGAIYNFGQSGESSPEITNATFTGNSAIFRGGAILNGGFSGGISSPVITNTILWGNTANDGADEIENEETTHTLAHTIIEGGLPSGTNDGGNNLSAAPLFVDASDPAGTDGILGTEDDGLRLQSGSPALNAGDNAPFEPGGFAEGITTDLLGEARIQNGTVDLGAYEREISGALLRLVTHSTAEAGTLELVNLGTAGVTGADVDLGLPAGVSATTTSGDGSVTSGTWTVDVLAGGTATVQVTYERDASADPGLLALIATLDTDSYTVDGGAADATQPDDATSNWALLEAPYGPGTALAFDGTDDGATAEAHPDLSGNAPWTIAFWAKVDGSEQDTGQSGDERRGWYLWKGPASQSANRLIAIGVTAEDGVTDGAIEVAHWANDNTYEAEVAFDSWQHVAVTYDGNGTEKVYLDGVFQDEHNVGTLSVNEGVWAVAQQPDGNRRLQVELDELRMWTEARSEADIQATMHETIPADTPELVASYRFDAAQTSQRFDDSHSGPTAYDLTGGRDATVEGDPQWTASGAPLGQESQVVAPGTNGTIGTDGQALTATVTSTAGRFTLYRYGDATADVFGGDVLPQGETERTNLVWGAVPSNADASNTGAADLTLSYGDVTVPNLSAVGLAERPGPTQPWTARAEEPFSETFTLGGQTEPREFALYDNGPSILYVDAAASGTGTGASWDDAFTDLQDALAEATGNDVITIAAGTYTPSARLDASDPRTATFEVTGTQDGLKIYGGWSGNESFSDVSEVEAAFDSRDLSTNETILSGDLDGDDGSDDNDDGIPDSGRGENAYHVLVFSGGDAIGNDSDDTITTDTVLDGVTITGGNADGSSSPNLLGGGLYCDGRGTGNACSPQITNATFTGNSARSGGAIYNNGRDGTSSPQITNATFTSNSAGSLGGAIYNNGINGGTSSPVVTNATFTGNSANDGGAIYNQGNFGGTSSPQITNATFTDNSAGFFGGAISNNGRDGTSSPQITNATFTSNSAETGGAIYNDGRLTGESSPQITNAILWGNTATSSGDEIVNDSATPNLTHTLIEGGVNGSGVGGDANNGDDTNLNTDPLFVDAEQPAGNDGTFATSDDGLRLVAGSPAVDAGTNAPFESGGSAEDIDTDLIGDNRLQDGNDDGTDDVNLGAYETPGLSIATSVTITGTDGTGTDAGWRVLSVPYTGAVAGDLRMTSSTGTNAPRFNLNVMAVWDDSDSDESTGGTGAYTTADASTPLDLGSGALLYLRDDARDPVESGGLTVSLDESSDVTRHGTAPVVRDDLTQSARWHLLGNPYPTDYELASLTTGGNPTGGSPIAGNGFKADAQVYDAPNSTWEIMNTGNGTLAAWQGVFIERSNPRSGPTSVTFEPGGRTAPNAPFIGSKMEGPVPTANVQRGTLWLEGVVTSSAGERVASDRAIGVRFHESATDGWDAWDTSKLAPLEAPSVMLSAKGTGGSGTTVSKAVESRPWPQTPDDPDAELTAVPMAVQGNQLPEDGTLTLQVREWDLPDTWAAELIDTQGTSNESDDQTVPLEPGMHYTVDVSSLSDNPETERFIVQVAPNEGALPVELAGFDAQRSGDEAIMVQWETLSETNNAGFEVQRAFGSTVETPGSDVSTWETIARLDGVGTTDEPQSYRFEDTQLPYAADSLTYRLRQVDTGGTESFSEPVTIARQVTEAELLPTYPNPARGSAIVRFAVPERQAVRIDLYDLLGRRVRTVVDTNTEGRTEAQLDVSGLASGTYFLRMQTEAGPVDTQRVTVVR